MIKTCLKCHIIHPLTDFSVDRKREDGLQAWCKNCQRTYNQAYYTTHKDEKAEYDRLFLYGLTAEEYENLFTVQDGRCAICHHQKELHVDHNHVTNKVRGLLCKKCNTALGGFNDSSELLKAALEYLDV
jgi:hypothetical protein